MKTTLLLLLSAVGLSAQSTQPSEFQYTAPGYWSCGGTSAPPDLNDDVAAHCEVPKLFNVVRVIDAVSYSKSQHNGDVNGASNSVRIVAGPIPPLASNGGYTANSSGGDIWRDQCPSWSVKQDGDGGVRFCGATVNPHLRSINGFAIFFTYYENYVIQVVGISGHDEPLPPGIAQVQGK